MSSIVPGWRLEHHDSLPSTSDLCIERAEAGEPGGLAVRAARQTRARGSRGRGWSEPPAGNLALSVLLRPDEALDTPGLWPFVAALALHEALAAPALSLKWPNDVMLDGRKLGGILVERGIGAGTVAGWLVIGFGANLAAAPVLADREAACLAELGPAPEPAGVAARLLQALDRWIAIWRGGGFEPVRQAWLARAHPPGSPLAVRGTGAQRTGRFAGIAADGALLLDADGACHRIETGEILLLNGS